MAMSSVHSMLRERKYPFAFAVSVLLVSAAFLLFSNVARFPSFSLSLPSRPLSSRVADVPPPPDAASSVSPSDNALRDRAPGVDVAPPVSPSRHDAAPSGPPPATDLPSPTGRAPSDRPRSPAAQNASIHVNWKWALCRGVVSVDYIPCLDNFQAIKALRARRHMEHRERHCPERSPRCLVPLPTGYKVPVPWPKSRDMIWFDNVPHPKLVEYKKNQNWVRKFGDYFVFPGGGTQFKEGVANYIKFIEKTFPDIGWGNHVRVVLDVGCGVASFSGYLLDRNVITMSFAPKDEHEAQIQFALERGIPAMLSVIGTRKLTFPDNAYDMIHCARCRVHWDADGGKPLMELNRILRPGGFFIWSATPVYRKDERDKNVWGAMVALTESMCWKVVAKTNDLSGIGVVIYQKPVSYSCYKERKENNPPLCEDENTKNSSWYAPLSKCLSRLPLDGMGNVQGWPMPWPARLSSKPPSLSTQTDVESMFYEDTKHWSALVSDLYLDGLSINWSSVRNVMDMNAGYGGFAAALIDLPLWVMNVVPINAQDTLAVIFDRGLIGTYHDWCESFNTYPRTYDLLHSRFLFGNLTQRCDIIDVVVEMDRILRPGGYVLVQDTIEIINMLSPVLHSLHWAVTLHQDQFLVGKKGFWRPQ